MKKAVNTLILDLDNTLFDWFAVWHASFNPIYQKIISTTGAPLEEIEADIRRVHQMRRTSEYTYLIEELDVLKHIRDKEDIRTHFSEAIETSQKGRDQNLKLYPSIFRSLWDLKKRGTKIVAYTESMGFYSAYRLKRFGLDGVIDVLFSPADHDTPKGVSLERMRRLPDEFYELQVTQVRHTPPGELKPNPKVLLDIVRSIGASVEQCAYVGDSLFKDVAMARDVGIFDIHAQYGESQRLPEYSLLQRVSHWTEEDVQREHAITKKGLDFTPSAVLKETFAEIYMYCDFQAFSSPANNDLELDKLHAVDIWKKCVEVQQHFNDLAMKTRNIAMTVVGALIAAISFTYQQELTTNILGLEVPAGLGLAVAAIFAWAGFFLMDRYWYHVLLQGAVAHASKIEKTYTDSLPSLSLGATISDKSKNVKILGIKTDSSRRLNIFYWLGFIILSLLFLFLARAESSDDKEPLYKVEIVTGDKTFESTKWPQEILNGLENSPTFPVSE